MGKKSFPKYVFRILSYFQIFQFTVALVVQNDIQPRTVCSKSIKSAAGFCFHNYHVLHVLRFSSTWVCFICFQSPPGLLNLEINADPSTAQPELKRAGVQSRKKAQIILNNILVFTFIYFIFYKPLFFFILKKH